MQAEDRSTESQRREIDRWLAYKDIDPSTVEWYEDEGHTGRDMARPAMKSLTNAIKAGRHEMIVAWDISRISRGFRAETLEWLGKLESHNVRLVLLQVGVDTETAWGKFFFRFQWLMGRLQSDLIGEGWKRVMDRRRDEGKAVGGSLRWGDATERNELIVSLKQSNPALTLDEIAQVVGRETGTKPDRSTVSRVLSRAREAQGASPDAEQSAGP